MHHQLPKYKLLITLLAISKLFMSCPAKAQNIDQQNIIDQQDLITRNQQNQLEEQRRLTEKEIIKKQRSAKNKNNEQDQEQSEISNQGNECFVIKKIKLSNANSLSDRQQKKLVSPFINKCSDPKTINELITTIQNFYNSQGYVSARVVVPKQNIKDGNFELKIFEGRIEKLIFNDNKLTDKMQKFTAFGFIDGKTLKLQEIDQGIYQINRLPSNHATMKIQPADTDGQAKIYVINQKKFPIRATASYDNLGNDFTGIKRTNFSSGFDNLLFLNDSINLNYSTNLNDDSQTKDIKSFTSRISIPFRFTTFSYDYSRSEFRGTNQGIYNKIGLKGFSNNNNFTVDHVLYSKANLRFSSLVSLSTKSSASYLNNIKIQTSQRKLSILNLSFSISDYFKNGISLYLKPSYFKGLKLLNAIQDEPNIHKDIPKNQFDYFKLYASISTKIIIPKTTIPLSISSEFDGQYAKQTLLGSEQFAVGGYYSVRGRRETFIIGDSGYNLRNKINFNIASVLGFFLKNNSNQPITENLNYFKNFSLEPFYDYGYVKNKYINSGADGRLAGTGIKTLFNSKYFNASTTFSWAINNSRLINS
ncbi:MAG: putative hemolysin activator protein, partial [Pseudomonadota bacterium]